jgi:Zn-finger in ubiquitin-hydrolases and other protein
MEVCDHLDQVREVKASADGCEDCLRMGGSWVHLRLCMSCGHVGCCDSSPHKHATAHFHSSGHPIVRTFEPGENWGWCYVDEVELDPTGWPVLGRVAHSVR